MQFDLRPLLEQGAKASGGLFMLIFRGGALITAFGLPAVILAHPPETESDIIAYYSIWGGMSLLLITLLLLLKFRTGVMPAQGALYAIEGNTLKVGFYKPGGKLKKHEKYALEELEFVDGGLTEVSASNMISGVRLKGSARAMRIALKKTDQDHLITTIQLLPGGPKSIKLLEQTAAKLNAQIARIRGITPSDIEATRRSFLNRQ